MTAGGAAPTLGAEIEAKSGLGGVQEVWSKNRKGSQTIDETYAETPTVTYLSHMTGDLQHLALVLSIDETLCCGAKKDFMPRPNRFAQNKGSKYVERNAAKTERFIYGVKPQHDSPLFQLPAEIRVEIWKFVLPRSESLKNHSHLLQSLNVRNHTTPGTFFHVWSRGNLALLRVCKRMHEEAVIVFWKSNSFDLVIKGVHPHFVIRYAPDLTGFVTQMPRVEKSLSSVRKDYVKLITGWHLMVPNHFGLDPENMEDALMDWGKFNTVIQRGSGDEDFKEFCEAQSGQRKRYRRQVLTGFEKWIALVAERDMICDLSFVDVTFFPYLDWAYHPTQPDAKLVRRFQQGIPSWLKSQIKVYAEMTN